MDLLTKLLVVDPLLKIIKEWEGAQLNGVEYSGSRAKGTAINLSSDIDLFISLKSDTTETLNEIYTSLYNYVIAKGIKARKQNVSIGVTYGDHSIDLVPGRSTRVIPMIIVYTEVKVDTWTKTNINNHINIVKSSGRLTEIIAIKLWSKLHKLDFPSIYIELTV